jgi:hypothetical protein
MAMPNKIHMQLPLTDRGHWPWWLATAFALALATLWWVTAPDDAAPAPAVRLASRVLGSDGGSPPATAPIQAATPTPAPAPVSASVPEKPPLKLVGTVMAGAGSMAMVRLTADSQLMELRVGDRVAGLAVTAIEPDRIVLAGGAQPVVVETSRAAPAPPPSRAASAPSSPKYAEGEAPWDLAPPFRH